MNGFDQSAAPIRISRVMYGQCEPKIKKSVGGTKGAKGREIGCDLGIFSPSMPRFFFKFFFFWEENKLRKDGKQRKSRQSSEDLQIVPSMVRIGIGGCSWRPCGCTKLEKCRNLVCIQREIRRIQMPMHTVMPWLRGYSNLPPATGLLLSAADLS